MKTGPIKAFKLALLHDIVVPELPAYTAGILFITVSAPIGWILYELNTTTNRKND